MPELIASLNEPYYAVDTTDRCAPGGQGALPPSSAPQLCRRLRRNRRGTADVRRVVGGDRVLGLELGASSASRPDRGRGARSGPAHLTPPARNRKGGENRTKSALRIAE